MLGNLRKSYILRKQGHISLGLFGRFPESFKEQITTDWAMGFFFVVRKSIINKYGIKWDEKLISYAYAEDLDFSYRYCKYAKNDGYKCIITDKVIVNHRVSKEWRETSRAVTFMEIFHREYFTYKWKLSLFSRLCTRWANLGTLFLRLVKWNHPLDVLKAQFYCDWYRHDIRIGNLHTDLYWK